jgi:cation transport ATPase
MKTLAMTLPTIVQGVRQNLVPWLAVKAVLTGLVFGGQVGVWTAFVLDTAVSILVLAYGWWLARR